VASMMAVKFDACAVNPGLGWGHFGHTRAQTEAISRNDINCYSAARSRFDTAIGIGSTVQS
jgi:hypothetical protein